MSVADADTAVVTNFDAFSFSSFDLSHRTLFQPSSAKPNRSYQISSPSTYAATARDKSPELARFRAYVRSPIRVLVPTMTAPSFVPDLSQMENTFCSSGRKSESTRSEAACVASA